MHIQITPENLLIQLGYSVTPVMMTQMEEIIANTKEFDDFSKHILSLQDTLKHYGGYIAMSNSSHYLKVKTEHSRAEEVEPFVQALERWCEKYKVALKKVEGKHTFYILGQA